MTDEKKSSYVTDLSQKWVDHLTQNIHNGGEAPDQISSILKAYLSSEEAEDFRQKEKLSQLLPGPIAAIQPIENENESNPRLVEAWALVDKMQGKGYSIWMSFFYPDKVRIAKEWAERARQDLCGGTEFKETKQVLNEGQVENQDRLYNKSPLTTEITLSENEQEVLSNVRKYEWALPFFIGIGAIASMPAWLPKVANVTNDEALLCMGIALTIYVFMSLHAMANHWNYSLTKDKMVIKDGETDSMKTVNRYNELVQEEKAETISSPP